MPQVLHAVAVTPPYDWDLTNISGRQTISVTATDSRGKTSTTIVTVTAPVSPGPDDGMSASGCAVGRAAGRRIPGHAPEIVGAAAAIALVRRRRRTRR
jgi:hypothetical protein